MDYKTNDLHYRRGEWYFSSMANLVLYVHPKNITMECGVTNLVSTMEYYNKIKVTGNILQNKNTGTSIGILCFQNILKI